MVTVSKSERRPGQLFGPGWADAFDMIARTKRDTVSDNQQAKYLFHAGTARSAAQELLEFLGSIVDVRATIIGACEAMSLIDQELAGYLESVRQLKNPRFDDVNTNEDYSFIRILKDHIDNRRLYYDIKGTGIPCMVFVPYSYKGNENIHYCAVSLSGHESKVQKGDSLQLVSRFFKLVELLISYYNHRIQQQHPSVVSAFHFLDYESESYSRFIARLSDHSAEHPMKSCGEKKAFSYLFKCNYQGRPIKVEGFQAVMMDFQSFNAKLKSRQKKKNIVLYRNKSQEKGYKLPIIKMCKQCLCNAHAYKAVIDIAAEKAVASYKKKNEVRKKKKVKKKKLSAKHRKKNKRSSIRSVNADCVARDNKKYQVVMIENENNARFFSSTSDFENLEVSDRNLVLCEA